MLSEHFSSKYIAGDTSRIEKAKLNEQAEDLSISAYMKLKTL